MRPRRDPPTDRGGPVRERAHDTRPAAARPMMPATEGPLLNNGVLPDRSPDRSRPKSSRAELRVVAPGPFQEGLGHLLEFHVRILQRCLFQRLRGPRVGSGHPAQDG